MPDAANRTTIIVTGASSGIGAAIADRLEASGARVFAAMRHPESSDRQDAIALDVTSDHSIATAVATVLERAGRIDGVVNNAGVDLVGAVEETTCDEALALFATNFFGVHRLIRAVLPTMRAQRRGRIVTIGSIAGFLPEPFQAFYCSSKHALEGYVECLDYEVRPFGIRALLVQPGFISTRLSANGAQASEHIEAYARRREHVSALSAKSIGGGTPPRAVAKAVQRLLSARRPPLRTRVGADAHRLYLLRHGLPPPLFRLGVLARMGADV